MAEETQDRPKNRGVDALERIAGALEKIALQKRRMTIGAVFGHIVDHAHKYTGPGDQHPDEYSHLLLTGLYREYPDARYPADITRYLTPNQMIHFADKVIYSEVRGDRQSAAQRLVYSLADAGFWDD